jgi:hypothetical protein
MSYPSLHDFVARVLADDRILFADLKRLQRDILPERITSREEAEILLLLDCVVRKTDREWTAYLTTTVRDFAVWGLHPAGSLDRGKAKWISSALACANPTRTARVILREIVQEARSIDDDALLELGLGGSMAAPGATRARQHPGRRATRPGTSLCAPAVWPNPSVRMESTAAQE